MANILVIEDQESMLRTLSTLLELEGYQVFTALEKDSVLDILDKHPIDLILLDVYLEMRDGKKVNGLEFLDDIRRNSVKKDIRVLMTSGSDLQDQVRQAGADGFIMKPYMPDTLLTLIQSHLGMNG
ncbi:MAG: response regulator [Anaerolineales bacterium]|nr:response regulator [Anaerolineales bacterium]